MMEQTRQEKPFKVGKLELAKRIRIVQDWILQDHTTIDIINQSMNLWLINERQSYRYLWAAKQFFVEKETVNAERKKAYYLARKKKLLRDMNSEDKKTPAGVTAVNRVLDSMAKLEGLNQETLKVIGDPDRPIKTVTEVTVSSSFIDYTKIPTPFLELLVQSRNA